MRALILTRYGVLGASSRMRFFQYLPALEAANWHYDVVPFFSDEQLASRYRRGGYGLVELLNAYVRRIAWMLRRQRYDLVWIEKEALPWLPQSLESGLLRGVPYVLDYDDAVFHNYDRHRLGLVRTLFGRRLDRLMAGARLVVAGNDYLAQRAIDAGARWVEVLPTVVELARYSAPVAKSPRPPRVVWIGSPSTVRYLDRLHAPLAELGRRIPFTLRVIGGGRPELPGVDVEAVEWSAETEAASIAECDVGVMPLEDSPWERGKCAYKLIQYMACGLPTVASPVGANCKVVVHDETGFFAGLDHEWVDGLERLLRDGELRTRLGMQGRARVEAEYCVERTTPKLIELLERAAGAPAGLSGRRYRQGAER